jgi:hypothetical protein
MKLTTVTITGADDAVEPKALAELSRRFPFVEWAILISNTRCGTPRYPSEEWIDALPNIGNLAAHFCGSRARDLMINDDHWLVARPLHAARIGRIQINGWYPGGAPLGLARMWPDKQLLLQARSEDALVDAMHDANRLRTGGGDCAILFDPSGGRGIETFSWPRMPDGIGVGFAGGISPSNVRQVIADIVAANLTRTGDFWIDMESGVRTADLFDLAKAEEVLSICDGLVER